MNALFKLMLKGSAVSALALTMAAVGCSDSDKDNETGAGGEDGGGKGGTPSTGGSSTDKGGEGGAGATTSTPGGAGGVEAGGTDAGGADAGGADAGGANAGGADSGVSVAKFCNDLTFGTEDAPMDTTFILEVGTGADKVTLTAKTGECSTIDGAACKSIPLGPEVPVKLFDADDTSAPLHEGLIDSADGDIWVFRTDLSDDAEPSPIAVGDAVTGVECKDITYDDAYSL